jgi:adenine/guanine/hypoxanthine permease
MKLMETFFKLKEQGTDTRTELLAGLTTFLTMAYIIFVPPILGDAGMPKDTVFVATCLAAAIGSLVMGLYANYPIALAPGMGLNAYFAYGVVKGMGYTWEAALGAVFISGCLFMIISLLRIREMIVNGIPHSIRTAITSGIGLFLAIIALKNSGIIVAHPATLITLGNLHKAPAILAIAGFFLIVALDQLRVKGAILIGIIVRTSQCGPGVHFGRTV